MEVGVEAARWVVGKALSPVSGGVLEAWAASTELGPNIRGLRMELLYAQGMLNNASGRDHNQEIQNPALAELLQELRDLGYKADDVLDELDYFRIQDELDGTYHAADEHEGGCLRNQALNARHTARAIKKMIGFAECSRGSPRHDEPDEETRRVCCGASWPCLGLTAPSDGEDQEQQEATRGVLCGAVWPCGGASAMPPVTPATSQHSDHQEVGDGCVSRLASTACDTIHSLGKQLPCCYVSSEKIDANANTSGWWLRRCCRRNTTPQSKHITQAPKLKFDRVEASLKMKEITEQLKHVCAKVSTILNLELLDSNRSIAHCIATTLDARFSGKNWRTTLPRNTISRPITTSDSVQKEIYGRKNETDNIISNITKGEYCHNNLTVLPIVGPGGIGKTTLIQHIYHDEKVQAYFDLKLWICVSINFSVYRLTHEIADKLANSEKDSPDKLIAEKLNSKRFLLVLDDMWSCSSEEEWERLLIPFKKGQTKGNVILVTTRIPQLAEMVKTTEQYIGLKGLDKEEFTKLFFYWVFGNEQPPNDQSRLFDDIGNKIKEKLKGSPLAAKTVGRLLKNHIDLDHWSRILESKQWEFENGENDIMPALKLSFDYLPFHLQQCFTYCALFPEDYKFSREELIHFWIGQDVLHSHGENKSIEEIGERNFTKLINHGFLKMEGKKGHEFYIIHDLLHELAQKVSTLECLSIYSTNVRSVKIPPSIRHLSIHIDDTSVKDRKTFDVCIEDFSGLGERLKVENLHTLMLFGSCQDSFVKIFARMFSTAKSLRVIFLSASSNYNVEDLLPNFSELVHLRYFRIDSESPPPNSISRFYHLNILDILLSYEWDDFPRDIYNLVKLRHFIVSGDETHTNLYRVGRMKSLQELRKFVVKKEAQDFELREVGKLLELGGSICISNLERVEVPEEAEEAKLMHKTHLRKLELQWDIERSNRNPDREAQVLEGLKPGSNLLELSIIGHGGVSCPSWLCVNLLTIHLETLLLNNVAWQIFPPIGKLCLVNERGEEYYSNNISNQSFHNLKRIELTKLEGLRKWVVDSSCEMFRRLKVLVIEDCPELQELSFSVSSCSEQEEKTTWFPKLRELIINNCPKLLSLPPIPWTRAPCSINIARVGLGFEKLEYGKHSWKSELYLKIVGNDAQDNALWTAVDFDKLTELMKLNMTKCPPMQLDRLQKLSCLKTINISNLDNPFCPVEDVHYQLPCEFISMDGIGASGKELTQVLSYMPKLSTLDISNCGKITGLGVAGQHVKASSSSSQVEVTIEQHWQQQNSKGDEMAEGLLLLPPQLQELKVRNSPELMLLRSESTNDGKGGEKEGGLQGLCSFRSLWIDNCPEFLSSYISSSTSCFPFPASLKKLVLRDVEGMETLAPLSNLSSLTELEIQKCGDLRGEGLWRLIAHGCLTQLQVTNFFGGSVPPEPHDEQQGPSFGSSKLQSLWIQDGIAGFLDARICSFLSSSLTELFLVKDHNIKRFTKQQDEALQLLTSIEKLYLWSWSKLRCLPAGLNRLPNLKKLSLYDCPAIRSLPTLPDSLQELEIRKCPSIQALPKDGLPAALNRLPNLKELTIMNCPAIRSLPSLPDSLQQLGIGYCPSIRALPKGGLPRSLRELDVREVNSEELERQCRKLKGTIPIVRVD